ncbi:hypothetical protein [Actinacidiphila yeochonensis]|uniref:hypothetical protein n=1 Tax=Actinacidiphila yeochonensis TaxID=89050 RepID=UPI0005668A79|nr:hypothetical protein [Actinacidiphila yeochonensis]
MTYQTSDASVQTALNGLDEQVTNMSSAVAEIEAIKTDVLSHYKAGSCTLFVSKMDDWVAQYNAVKKAVDNLADTLGAAKNIQNKGEDLALSGAGGSFGGGEFYTALSPNNS